VDDNARDEVAGSDEEECGEDSEDGRVSELQGKNTIQLKKQ